MWNWLTNWLWNSNDSTDAAPAEQAESVDGEATEWWADGAE